MIHGTKGYRMIYEMLAGKGFKPFPLQEETWQKIIDQESDLVNASIGCEKTFFIFLDAMINFINNHLKDLKSARNPVDIRQLIIVRMHSLRLST